VALERSLTELLQGRSFEGLNDLPRPTFESNAVTEPNNFVEHFIDSSGVVSWRFFSAKADYDFVEWDFSGRGENSNADEAATLFGILEDMGKEVYMAVYDQLGATACRILVPGYSEIYPVEDLIWDNTNKALLVPRRHPEPAPPRRCRRWKRCSSAWKTASWMTTPTSSP
jgi:ribosomal protein S12 methylthiotransferase accessory factor